MERKEAQNLKLKTYITGRPCRKEHVTYRYTQSGSCSECINGGRRVTPDENSVARLAARDQLVKIPFRIFDEDREVFASAVHLAAVMRCPQLQPSDTDRNFVSTGRASGTALYHFYCFPADIEPLRGVASSLTRKYAVDTEQVRKDALAIARRFDEVEDSTPPMNFK